MRFGLFGVDVTVGEEVPHPDDLAEEHSQLDQTNDDGDYDRLCRIEMLMHDEYGLVLDKRGNWVTPSR